MHGLQAKYVEPQDAVGSHLLVFHEVVESDGAPVDRLSSEGGPVRLQQPVVQIKKVVSLSLSPITLSKTCTHVN